MDFSRFTTISFDCYGTLIDWEAGLLPVIHAALASRGVQLGDAAILELYGEFEAEAESGAYRSYRTVLEAVVQKFADRFGFRPSEEELGSLHESIPRWRPFPDTVAALRALKQRYQLAVISNIDDDLFEETRKHLEIAGNFQFDWVITAQQARSYKPSARNFELALSTMKIAPKHLLHAAQSLYHDVVSAQALGIGTVWVNRNSARPGVGAVRQARAKPDLEVPDLATLAGLALKA